MIKVGSYRAGLYCGERWWRARTWHRHYGWYRKTSDRSFSLGPVLFWREARETDRLTTERDYLRDRALDAEALIKKLTP